MIAIAGTERPSATALQIAGLCVAGLVGVLVPLSSGAQLPQALLVVAGFVTLVVLLVTRVITAVDLLVIGSPFMFIIPAGHLNMAAADLILPLAVLQTLVAYRHADPSNRLQPRHVAYLVALVMAVTVSSIGGLLVERDYLAEEAVIGGMKLVVGVGYLLAVLFELRTKGLPALLRLLRLWSWVAVGLAAASIITAIGLAPLVPYDGERSNGFFTDPNLFGAYLIVSLVLVLTRNSIVYHPTWLLQAVVIAGGVITTGSRGSMMTLVAVLVAGFLFMRRLTIRLSILSIGAALFIFISTALSNPTGTAAAMGTSRLISAAEKVESDGRILLWQKALELWSESPLTGVGLGQFAVHTANMPGYYRPNAGPDTGYVAHNTFLSLGVETGVLGLGLVLFGLVWVARRLYSSPPVFRDARTALILGIMALALEMMTLNLQNLRYVWMFFGVAIAFPHIAAAAQASEEGPDGQDAGLSVDRRAGASRVPRHPGRRPRDPALHPRS